MSSRSKHDSIEVEEAAKVLLSVLEHAQQRLIQTIKSKESRYVVHNWIIYARLSVFDSYQDTIVIVISKLLSISAER